jgi:tripartite-type tricarboxylate transporter receptor subunit TctC
VLAEPEVVQALRNQGLIPSPNTSEQFKGFIRAERDKWSRVAKAVNLRLD